ncbi:site-specific integrase [bacterium]|nr:site-specific integrase [bacterium]
MIKELAEKLAEGRSPATVNRYLAAVSHVLTVARDEWELCDANPVHRVKKMKESQGRDRVLTADEQTRLLAAAEQHPFLHTAITLALATGARRAEIWKLNWSQVDFEQRHIVLRQTKNDKPRILLLRGLALKQLKELYANRQSAGDFVFHTASGNKSLDMRSAWRTALKKAKIQDFRWHDLRHTAITRMAKQGATLMELQLYSGHSSAEMVRKYAHLTESQIGDKVEQMVTLTLG